MMRVICSVTVEEWGLSARLEGDHHQLGQLVGLGFLPLVHPVGRVLESQNCISKLFTFFASTMGYCFSSGLSSMTNGFCRKTSWLLAVRPGFQRKGEAPHIQIAKLAGAGE